MEKIRTWISPFRRNIEPVEDNSERATSTELQPEGDVTEYNVLPRKSIHVPTWSRRKLAVSTSTPILEYDDQFSGSESDTDGGIAAVQPDEEQADINTKQPHGPNKVMEGVHYSPLPGEGVNSDIDSEDEDCWLSSYTLMNKTRRRSALDISPEERMAFRLMIESSRGHGTEHARQWLQNRLSCSNLFTQVGLINPPNRRGRNKAVITPETIPDFVIPTTRRSNPLPSFKRHQANSQSLLSVNSSQSSHSSAAGFQSCGDLSNPTFRHVATLPGQLSDISSVSEWHVRGDNDYDGDGEGGYPAALSFPHLRTRTSYGFTTLTEHPHTRRKESLLLGGSSVQQLLMFQQLSSESVSEVEPRRAILHFPGEAIDESLESISSSDHLNTTEQQTLLNEACHRLSNLSDSSGTGSMTEDGKTDYHPTLNKRASYTTAGWLQLSITYREADKSLAIKILKADILAKDVGSSFVKVILKHENSTQKQQTEVIKGTNCPSFDSNLVFQQISADDIKNISLLLQVYCRVGYGKSLLNSKKLLGELDLHLSTVYVEAANEVTLWKEFYLQTTVSNSIDLSMQFNPREELLSVDIHSVKCNCYKQVSKKGVYVKVSVDQGNGSRMNHQTKMVKATGFWVFNETVKFNVSPKLDILDHTLITVKVIQKEKLRSNLVLGEVTVGCEYVCSAKTSFNYWNDIMKRTNQSIRQTFKFSGVS